MCSWSMAAVQDQRSYIARTHCNNTRNMWLRNNRCSMSVRILGMLSWSTANTQEHQLYMMASHVPGGLDGAKRELSAPSGLPRGPRPSTTHARKRLTESLGAAAKCAAHAGSRARVTSMGGLYDAATLHAPIILLDHWASYEIWCARHGMAGSKC